MQHITSRSYDKGLLIPKQLLEGIQEVKIRKETNLIFIVLLVSDDAILQLRSNK